MILLRWSALLSIIMIPPPMIIMMIVAAPPMMIMMIVATPSKMMMMIIFQHHQLTKLREAINQKYGENLHDYHQVRMMMRMAKKVMMNIVMAMMMMTNMVMMMMEENHNEIDVDGNNIIMIMRQLEKLNCHFFLISSSFSSSIPGLFRTMASSGKRSTTIFTSYRHLQHQSHPITA